MAEKERILVVLSRFPFPLEKGDKLRAYHQIKELSKKYDITLFCTHDKKVTDKQIEELRIYCDKIIKYKLGYFGIAWNILVSFILGKPLQIGYFYSSRARNKIKQEVESTNYKHIYCQLIRSSELVKNIHTIPKTIDFMDALSAGIQRRTESQPFYLKWIFKRETRTLQDYERRIFDYFENRTIISEQDRSLIRHQERNEIIVIPNGVDRSFLDFRENVEEKYDLVFVGNMSYPPNVEAVKYIEEHILSKNSELTLLVSGSNPHSSIKRIAEQNSQIFLTGWVDDIRHSYKSGKIFLAPMTIGTGMQNKLLEAMALGVPCVTTPLANNAIHATPGDEIIVADKPEEIYRSVVKLLKDQLQRESLAKNAKEFIENNYSWEKTTSILIDRIEKDFN